MATTIPAVAVYIVLFVFLESQSGASNSPSVDSPSMNISYSIGNNAELTCNVYNLGRNTVVWRRLSDPVPISIGTAKFTPSKKYRVRYDSSKKAWTLYIKRLGVGDAGEYECSVTGVDRVSKTVSLIMPGKDHTYIEPVESIVEADPGQTVLLPCRVQNIKKNKVLWVNEKGEVMAFRKRVYAGSSRVRMIHPTRGEWSLKISRITKSDFGSYTCIVNSNPVLTRTITVRRKGPPRFPPQFIRDDHDMQVKVKEGDLVTLTCTFKGFPIPKISWSARMMVNGRKVKKRISSIGPELIISHVTPEDAGNYTCTGTNGISPLARGKVRLAVEPLPTTPGPRTTPPEPTGPMSPIVYPEMDRVGARKGHQAYLVCHSVGHPGPTMYWKFNGRDIDNSYKYRVRHTDNGEHRRQSEVRVTHLVTEDYGDYECFAHNNRGHSGSKVTLHETFD